MCLLPTTMALSSSVHILDGSASIKTEDGNEFQVSAGDGFTLDSGLKVEWTVETFVKKHFMICQV